LKIQFHTKIRTESPTDKKKCSDSVYVIRAIGIIFDNKAGSSTYYLFNYR